ncbi:MAG: ABC transporter permease [Desulfocapsa sp.]|uniref:ABC transporter permease n=1 Tax=Desulfotalea psychrophila TaxID=84980 RepID=A0ABS3AVT5_9BACT|nr:ABC transporter permease [Desulfocapsa sp.]MBN4048707.1 ABC transporter permease [bacterium AH-315-N22]MBN4058783.1 ABC transporter permease [Desulfocapsa sp. AH-315-J15]MBN4068883.1 ABC transporter permease [Desulfotalea psychrophila]
MRKLGQVVIKQFGVFGSILILGTVGYWVVFMIVLPQLIMLDYSFRPFLPLRKMGGPEDIYTLKNYIVLFTNEFHRAIFIKTIWASVIVTVSALFVCYPISFYLAKVAKGARFSLVLLGLIVPYWINELLRIFAWQLILADTGIFNQLLLSINLVADPINFRAGNGAVIMGMVYAYILFMVFPLYNAMESLDRNQIDAARDLGASWPRIHKRIVIPHAKPGIAVGCIMTFMLAAGSIAAPQLLGSPSSFWFTQVIYTNFETANWNQGAAYSMVLAGLCLVFIFSMMKIFKVNLRDIAK